jgi:hypothetical protein
MFDVDVSDGAGRGRFRARVVSRVRVEPSLLFPDSFEALAFVFFLRSPQNSL